jgi:[protein-PII] uridylyltransferase
MTVTRGNPTGLAEELKQRIVSRMDDIRARHDRGAGGIEVCRAISNLMDEVVVEAFRACHRQTMGDRGNAKGLTLVALGGYGRTQLNPHSDIDLLFLHPGSLSPDELRIIEATIPLLWDAGLRVGHSCRSVDECLETLEKDLPTYTSLLEGRLLDGNRLIYARLRDAMAAATSQSLRWFVESKIEERRDRWAGYGNTVLLLEPNVKESPGGLRDYHHVIWLAIALWGSFDLAYLGQLGALFRPEKTELLAGVDFLLRVRNGLHFMANSQQDQIYFRSTDALARHLGYHERAEGHPEDALMRDYYRHARAVRNVADAVEHRALRMLEKGKDVPSDTIDLGGGFISRNGELSAEECTREFFAAEPARVFEVFRWCGDKNLLLHPLLREALEQSLDVIDDSFRASPERRDQFQALLRRQNDVAPLVEAMHGTGVLTRYLPELIGMHHLAIDDLYHRFTVDGHTMVCMEMLDRLLAGKVRWASSETRKLGADLLEAAQGVDRLDLLRLGLLFHDAGKGYGSRHSERGAELIDAVARRWELDSEDRSLLVFLVEKHLVLTDVAYRRDPEDPKIIQSLAEEVGDTRRARKLLALTLADIMGVTPGLLSEWKIVLLWRLYGRLVDVLEGRLEAVATIGEEREALVRRLGVRFGEETVRHHLKLLPSHYLIYAAEDQMNSHLELLGAYDGEAAQVKVRTVALVDSFERTAGPKTCFEVHVCTQDRMGLFRDIVHACERENLEVNSARIFTRKDGVVLDTIVAVNRLEESELDSERMELLRRRLLRDLDPQRRVRRRSSPLSVPGRVRTAPADTRAARIRSQSHVKASGEISGDYTVIEFRHHDEPMLLAHVAEFLTDHDLDIQYARIYHEGRRIVGAFHVTDAEGRKIVDQEKLDQIENELREALKAHQAFQEASDTPIG